MKHLKELDGVRGLAALMVMGFHFFQFNGFHGAVWKEIVQKVSIFGQTGVTLFFVLSGFLITRILLKTKNENDFFKIFYIRRMLRIFPLYYFFLTIYYFILPLLFHTAFIEWNKQWYFWVYLQNFAYTFNWSTIGPNHFWSLAVEEHFYFIWPMIVYFLPIRKITYTAYFLILLSFFVRVGLLHAGYGVFYFTFTNLDALSAGALLAIKEFKCGRSSFLAKTFRLQMAVLIVPTIILWIFSEGKSLAVIQAFKFPLIAFIYYSFIGWVIAVGESSFLKSAFKMKPMLYAGKISYGLYVYHPIVFMYYAMYWKTGYFISDFLICFISSFLIATLSYYLFESKILNFKKYFEYGKDVNSYAEGTMSAIKIVKTV